MNLTAVEIKAFVPARDLDASLAFYRALGFEVPWASPDLAYVKHGETSFLLQKFYVAEHANNYMMHLLVEDVEAWHQNVLGSGVLQMPGVKLFEPPKDHPWAIRDFPLSDPTGVLWRIGQNIPGWKPR